MDQTAIVITNSQWGETSDTPHSPTDRSRSSAKNMGAAGHVVVTLFFTQISSVTRTFYGFLPCLLLLKTCGNVSFNNFFLEMMSVVVYWRGGKARGVVDSVDSLQARWTVMIRMKLEAKIETHLKEKQGSWG